MSQPKALWTYQSRDLFAEVDTAAFDLALAGAMMPSGADKALIARVRAHWDDGELVEMKGVIALVGFLCRRK